MGVEYSVDPNSTSIAEKIVPFTLEPESLPEEPV
jgi:hypothetical protein